MTNCYVFSLSNLAFAFGLYGTWLVSAVNSDFESGYRMGCLAINLMNRLEAKEVSPRCNVLSLHRKREFSITLSHYFLVEPVHPSCLHISLCMDQYMGGFCLC